jgi:uncharacterized protein (TIGR02145 family)
VELTFTADNNGQYVPLDLIFIENLTQGGDTTLYAPDTILMLDYNTSISENEAIGESSFYVTQNCPNPFIGETEINLNLTEREDIAITVRDILGRELAHYENTMKRGNHTFGFYSGNEIYYLLTVSGKQTSKTIKMLSANSNLADKGKCKIVYKGSGEIKIGFKSQQAINSFMFSIGDELKLYAYSYLGSRTIIDSPIGNQTYTFQFASDIPCPDMPTITDIDGNTYNTVQIGSQCWMKENLKTTAYQDGAPIPNVTDNNAWQNLAIGAYVWYDNDISWKGPYGALYNWYAMVDANGLCPTGWHVPTNDEWTVLTDFIGGTTSPHGNELKSCRQVNSPQGGGCNTNEHPRWHESNEHGTDDYGFSGLPGGYRDYDGAFHYYVNTCYWWSYTEYSFYNAWFRSLYWDHSFVGVNNDDKRVGFSVRCLRD